MSTENHRHDPGVRVTVSNLLVLAGSSAHQMYWGDDEVADQNALSDVVGALYTNTVLLARAAACRPFAWRR